MMINFRDSFERKFEKCVLPKPKICKTDGIKSPMVFCVDKICKEIPCKGQRCDEIVLSASADKSAGVYCIENKEGKPTKIDAEDVARQLQGGADIVNQHFADEGNFQFLPVLATPYGVSENIRQALLRKKVRLQGIPKKIKVVSKKEDAKLPTL